MRANKSTHPLGSDPGGSAISATEPATFRQSHAPLRTERRLRPRAGRCLLETAETPDRRLFRAKFAWLKMKAHSVATMWAAGITLRHKDQTSLKAKSHSH